MPPLPAVSWEQIVDHIDHVVKLVGPTHVGLGSDFDGATMPRGDGGLHEAAEDHRGAAGEGLSEPT